MYQFLLDRFGRQVAYWGTLAWFSVLLVLVVLSFSTPAAEFRYANL